ncbi:hypothetical protein BGX34_004426 [Mortierella sp. NVP85]|nr:hypothetical protein BGX34_004426 [Mortierella sp. NVP85]
MEWPSWPFKLGGSIIFDPSNLQEQRSEQHQRKLNRRRHRRVRRFHIEDANRSLICWQSHSPGEACHCRKRSFSAATEWSYALSASSRTTADHHPEWIESVKKRKIHQQATKWTSTLSPPPYVKLLTMRDFWDVVEARLENKDDSRSSVRTATFVSGGQGDSLRAIVQDRSERRRDVRQYPCPIPFLRGLWEEELRVQRERQMIPDTVRRPPRSKIFNARPIATTAMSTKPVFPSLLGTASASTASASTSPASSASSSPSATQVSEGANETQEHGSQPSTTEMELSLKKKHRAAAIVRSHAISEGSDMSEYKPWKDGTVTPKQGSLRSLKDLRCNIMDPWPLEESKSKVECTRVLHRMREQLNIVINLQIHLRSMIKAAPTQWSFLLSIRHPGQVSIELLLALYGPHFMQTNSFRAIEQLLWGAKGHSQPQPHADTSSSTSSLLQA